MQAVARLKTEEQFLAYLSKNNITLPFETEWHQNAVELFSQTYDLAGKFKITNRFCIHPMEGWDGELDGSPGELTIRRWRNFGSSGAKLIWGGEAVAVRHEGRANPNQLLLTEATLPAIARLKEEFLAAHTQSCGTTEGLLLGLQLTHSGRFSRPDKEKPMQPKILYHHPYLDNKFGIAPNSPVLSDAEVESIIADFVKAACWAQQMGFHFVDLKHCHGYLGHEFLSAYSRPGRYGGSFENRTRFLKEMVNGIRINAPGLEIGVRLSMFDLAPFEPDPLTGVGKPAHHPLSPQPFGADANNHLTIDLTETKNFLQLLQDLDIKMVNLTAGSPYYNPHIQRPALYPPSDGYLPPEDPLVGVARQINTAAELKKIFPDLLMVGTAYTYLQEWLLPVAAAAIRHKMIDFIGLGRMVLSFPQYPLDVLNRRTLNRQYLCRTFSDCTTAPRNGMPSGCYVLDGFYKRMPEFKQLTKIKQNSERKT